MKHEKKLKIKEERRKEIEYHIRKGKREGGSKLKKKGDKRVSSKVKVSKRKQMSRRTLRNFRNLRVISIQGDNEVWFMTWISGSKCVRGGVQGGIEGGKELRKTMEER